MSRPVCPDPTHLGRKVWRDGYYGTPGHLRQRWRCLDVETGDWHRFVEVLPRQQAKHGRCLECETGLDVWEGPQSARLYHFSSREIARALVRVAEGMSYRSTAEYVRGLAGRRRPSASRPAPNNKRNADNNAHGGIVANWVEVFAGPIFEHYAVEEWPERLAADADEFRCGVGIGGGGRRARGPKAFNVFCAVGSSPTQPRPKIWHLKTYPQETQQNWADFFTELDGTPRLIVADGGRVLPAAQLVFPRHGDPAPDFRRCEWHLGKNIRDKLPEYIRDDPKHPLMIALATAFLRVADWQMFSSMAKHHAAHTGELHALVGWLANNDALVTANISTRTFAGPNTVGAVEEALSELDRRLGDRTANFGNRYRTNQLLKLMQLDLNGDADEVTWAELIRDHVARRGGRAREQRRHDDQLGVRSIRP